MKFQKFIPLLKMEEAADGSLKVFGLVTEEKPDLDKEVCDYATTKPLYEKRTKERWELTSKIAGMTPSLMAARGQHDPKQAIGAGRMIEFDDALRAIKMGFDIVDTEAIKKWKAGVFVGFSQGGDYVAKWEDPVYKGCVRYTADPFEVSSVDSPCLPSALAESMKGRTVTLTKSSGVTEQVPLEILPVDQARLIKLERETAELRALLKEAKTKTVDGVALSASCFAHVGDPDDTSTWKLPIKFPGDADKTASHIRNALARFEQTEGMSAEDKAAAKKKILAAAKEAGIEASENEKSAIARACGKVALRKGLYEVGYFAEILESLNWLCMQTEWERDFEDDGSKLPEEMREPWLALLEAFKAMAEEEADEMAASAKGEKSMKIATQADLTKAAKTISDHLEKHMEMHKALHEKIEGALAKDHPIMKAHAAMMDHCEKCMKAAKDAGAGEQADESEAEKAAKAAAAAAAANADPIAKLTAENAALSKKFDDLMELLKKTPAGGAPHTGAVDLSKVAGASAFDALQTPPEVTH
jgi:hypothetical protein